MRALQGRDEGELLRHPAAAGTALYLSNHSRQFWLHHTSCHVHVLQRK